MNAPLVYRVPKPHLYVVHDSRKPAAAAAAAADDNGWQDVHRRITQLGEARAAHEREICRGLLQAEHLGVHARLGYASLKEYAERVVGLSARQCEERLRVGRALEHLPQMEQALAGGKLCWSVVRELTRVATAENESVWLDWVHGRRASEVAAAVAERKAGDTPDAKGDPELVRHQLNFEVRAETMALFRELQATVRRDLGVGDGIRDGIGDGSGGGGGDEMIDGDTLLFEIARRALAGAAPSADVSSDPSAGPSREGSSSRPNNERARAHEPSREGPVDAGRPHYQIAVTRCPACGDTSIEAGGRTHRLEPNVAEMVDCDAQIIGSVDSPQPPSPRRATQTIPPATRRAVIRRHHSRCAVPGCRHCHFLDIHHVTPRAEGGSHDPDQLVVLCGAHHRALHRGHLRVTGNAQAGFRFFHADGTPYGKTVDPLRHEVARRVLLALTNLGFRRKEAEHRLRAAQHADPTPPDADFEGLLRAALAA